MKIILSKLANHLLDAFFPIKCLICQKEGEWICAKCLSSIKTKNEHICPICEKVITPDGRTCHACKRKSYLDGLLSAVSYNEPYVSRAVHLFKYRFVSDLHLPLANLIIQSLRKTEIPLPDKIIPIPLHPKRLRWRGFNQSKLLANHISKNLLTHAEIEVAENILFRTRFTSPQMEIKNYQERKKNISNAFAIQNNGHIKNKTILLIDDVATTASTIQECAKILKRNGAKEVYAAVIARQEFK